MMHSWADVEKEAISYLQKLIKFNTSNPPGNELPALIYLEEIAKKEGLKTELYITSPNRGNLVISLQDTYSKPIILLSHVDVVPADAADWEVPPFEGIVKDGYIWGRGTIDTKQLTIIHLMQMLLLKKENSNLDLIMVVTSDEEAGSKNGLLKLLAEKGTIFQDAFVFNEGGGFPLMIRDTPYYLAEMGQKGVAKVKFTFESQFSENPYLPNHQPLADLIEFQRRFTIPLENESIPDMVHHMFQVIANNENVDYEKENPQTLINSLPEDLHRLLNAMTQTTFALTRWRGGGTNNRYEVFMDSRTLPYLDREAFEEILLRKLSGLTIKYEILSFSQGYETALDLGLLSVFKKNLQEEVENSRVVPYLSIGSSDGRHLLKYQSKVYGYCPTLLDMPFHEVIKMVHGVNEKISVQSFVFGIKQLYKILKNFEAETV